MRKIVWEWEALDESTSRTKVIGGWLVLHINQVSVGNDKKRELLHTESMAFVADTEHRWQVVPPLKEIPKNTGNVLANDFKA